MRLTYTPIEQDEHTKAVASKIVAQVLSSGITYRQADAALSEAQRMIWEETKPISAHALHQDDSESKS